MLWNEVIRSLPRSEARNPVWIDWLSSTWLVGARLPFLKKEPTAGLPAVSWVRSVAVNGLVWVWPPEKM